MFHCYPLAPGLLPDQRVSEEGRITVGTGEGTTAIGIQGEVKTSVTYVAGGAAENASCFDTGEEHSPIPFPLDRSSRLIPNAIHRTGRRKTNAGSDPDYPWLRDGTLRAQEPAQ